MTHRSLGRLNDQALAALSAVIYVPMRRIGFLIMPLIWLFNGASPAAVRPGPRHMSDIFAKIKATLRAPTRCERLGMVNFQ
jgi:hypothetical protein